MVRPGSAPPAEPGPNHRAARATATHLGAHTHTPVLMDVMTSPDPVVDRFRRHRGFWVNWTSYDGMLHFGPIRAEFCQGGFLLVHREDC